MDYDLGNTEFRDLIEAHLSHNGGFDRNKLLPLLGCDAAAMAVRNSSASLHDMVPEHLHPIPPGMHKLLFIILFNILFCCSRPVQHDVFVCADGLLLFPIPEDMTTESSEEESHHTRPSTPPPAPQTPPLPIPAPPARTSVSPARESPSLPAPAAQSRGRRKGQKKGTGTRPTVPPAGSLPVPQNANAATSTANLSAPLTSIFDLPLLTHNCFLCSVTHLTHAQFSLPLLRANIIVVCVLVSPSSVVTKSSNMLPILQCKRAYPPATMFISH
jgi:hypothetical protein